MKKKLTHSSGVPIALCVAALLISAAAVASEYIGRYTYSLLFSKNTGFVVTDSAYDFFESYSKAILLLVLAILFLIAQISSYKVKRLGGVELSLVFSLSLIMLILSLAVVRYNYNAGSYQNMRSLESEQLFMCLFKEGIEWATALSALLLCLSSGILLIRLVRESFFVGCVAVDEPQEKAFENDKGLVF